MDEYRGWWIGSGGVVTQGRGAGEEFGNGGGDGYGDGPGGWEDYGAIFEEGKGYGFGYGHRYRWDLKNEYIKGGGCGANPQSLKARRV